MADRNDPPRIDPARLTPAEMARLLSAGGQRVSEEMVREDLEAGAPRAAEGTMNLVHYAAWLVARLEEGRP